jgi:protocatechuate 3,4-dioxygenase beta subunit
MFGALVAAVSAVVGLGLSVPPVAQAAGGTITGVVTDTAGVPIVGATVVLMSPTGTYFLPGRTSDAAGRYTFASVGPSTSIVVAQAAGFATRFGNAATRDTASSVIITADETVDFPVVLPRKTAVISGRVTDPSGAPLEGVQVNLFSRQNPPFLGPGADFNGYGANTLTDADGRYRVTDLAPTPFVVSFFPNLPSPNGPPLPSPFLKEFFPNKFIEADAVPVTPAEGLETSGIDAQLDLGATISGTVTDPSGNPVAGASVYSPTVEWSSVAADADGRYTLIGIPPGTAQVVADGPYPSPWLAGFYGGANFDTATQIPVAFGQTIDGIDIRLQAAGTVNVTVVRPDGSLAAPRMTPCADPGVPYVGPTTIPGYAPNVLCTAGGQFFQGGSFEGTVRLPAGTYNAAGHEGAGQFGSSVVTMSEVARLVLPADGVVDCVFTLGGSGSCAPADPATNDADGVGAAIEDRAPNGGDGNSDGIRDATQGNVTSLPAAIGGGYATVVVPPGQNVESINVTPSSYLVTLPIVTGAISLVVKGVPVGATTDISIIDSNGGTATEVRALSRLTFSAVAVPAEISGKTFTAHIVDGGLFDQAIASPNSPPDGEVRAMLIPVVTGAGSVGPRITCPSPGPTFAVGQPGATVFATVSDTGGGVAGPPFINQVVDTSRAGAQFVQVSAADLSGNNTTVSCPYTVVDDGDGVAYLDEAFDVNGDTVADSLQGYVAPAVGTIEQTVFFASPNYTQLSALSMVAAQSVIPPSGLSLTSGLASATIFGLQPGASISVDLIQRFSGGDQVWQSSQMGWARLPAAGSGGRLTVTLVDGGSGDTDGLADGRIVFSGAILGGDSTPPTIACGSFQTFNQRQVNAIVTATAFDFGSGLVGDPNLTASADTSVGGYGFANFSATDNAGNVASASCQYFVIADTDGDGAADQVEDSSSYAGDGNGDGIRDSVQNSVVGSYVPGYGYGFIAVSTGGRPISGFTSTDYTGTPAPDAATQLRGGVHRFTVVGSGAAVSASLFGGGDSNATLMLHNGTWRLVPPVVTDGGAGDNDGAVNGRIELAISRALVDRTPPTITCFDPGTLLLNQPGAVLYAYVADDVSGVAESYLQIPISTANAGQRSVAVTASDLAGNPTTVSCSYAVGVNLDRMIAPRPTVTAVAKARSTIAVRWRATDYFGEPVSDAAHFVGVSETAATCIRGEKEDVDPVRNRGLRYLGNGRWQFDWTVSAAKGCYSLQLDLVGATSTVPLKVV